MAKNVARTKRCPDLPMLVVPHPFETLSLEQVQHIAEERFGDIVSALAGESPRG